MATTIDVREGQHQLSKLLEMVKAGQEVVIAEGSTPIARLTAIQEGSSGGGRTAGLHPGAIQSSEDFDEPLPDSFWTDRP